jgi:pentatricopeptide repeat protein
MLSQMLQLLLVACGRKGYLSLGKGIHGLIIERGFGLGLEVSNALMDMYVKYESLPEEKQVFDELPEKDIVSWTSIICGMVQCKFPKEVLELFCDVQSSGIEPDWIILTSVLSARARSS